MAIAFALALIPLIGAAGATVDYSRATSLRAELQKVADSAALVAAAGTEDFDVRKEEALLVVESQLRAYPGVAYRPEITPVMENGREVAVRVTLAADTPTSFLGVVGVRDMDVSVESRATSGREEVFDIAFVLDTTGSMEGARLDVLKETTTQLIDDITARRGATDQVRVSVVPFGQYVNVGLGNRMQPWLDVPSDYERPSTRTCEMVREVVGRQCQRVLQPARPARPRTCYDDGRAYQCGSEARPARWVEQCTPIHGDGMVEQCRTRGGGWVRWNGCVGSRNAPNDTQDGNYSIRVPGLMNVSCGSPILEPTTNLASAKAHIRSLRTDGETYIPAGLMWGWRTLTPHAPIAARESRPGAVVERYMVLVTDGRNTRSATYPEHGGQDSEDADDVLRATCRNMAADEASDITLYTIAFEVTDVDVKELLEECSSMNGGAFYDAANAAELGEAMKHIGGQISRLRLTH
ncbi:pilus assembly protein TadG-related protein [Salinarimonas ramus]|uniref:pilus assembly protein TadG-related protein n=1 Tax=Salinarimonas ramus TaxID=690164 RepID=UPI00166AEB57|nr:pilus assembly protein TadG-related protein [Salinarimonas ramus]